MANISKIKIDNEYRYIKDNSAFRSLEIDKQGTIIATKGDGTEVKIFTDLGYTQNASDPAALGRILIIDETAHTDWEFAQGVEYPLSSEAEGEEDRELHIASHKYAAKYFLQDPNNIIVMGVYKVIENNKEVVKNTRYRFVEQVEDSYLFVDTKDRQNVGGAISQNSFQAGKEKKFLVLSPEIVTDSGDEKLKSLSYALITSRKIKVFSDTIINSLVTNYKAGTGEFTQIKSEFTGSDFYSLHLAQNNFGNGASEFMIPVTFAPAAEGDPEKIYWFRSPILNADDVEYSTDVTTKYRFVFTCGDKYLEVLFDDWDGAEWKEDGSTDTSIRARILDNGGSASAYGDDDVKTLLAGRTLQSIIMDPASSYFISQIVVASTSHMGPAYVLANWDETAGDNGQIGSAKGGLYLEGGDATGYQVSLGTEQESSKVMLYSTTERPYYAQYTAEDPIINELAFKDDVIANPTTEATTSIDKLSVQGVTYNILPQAYKDYLDEVTFKKPEISTFQILNDSDKSVAGTYEYGTTVTVSKIKHKETNITNIKGNLSIGTISMVPVNTDTVLELPTPESIVAATTYTLSGTDTRNNTISKSATITFNRYAYSKLTTAEGVPTAGLTKEAEQSSFKSSGKEYAYTAGQYLYIYLTETGKQAETNVLGQWVSVESTESGPVEIVQANGTTYNYYAYKIGPFVANGSAKYRVK